MKIIDLLNKIANGEEVPKKIKWENIIYAYSEYDKDYLEYPFSDEEYKGLFDMRDNILTQFLNDEVEILDEPKDNFTGWKMYQDGKVICSIDCSVDETKDNSIERLDIEEDAINRNERFIRKEDNKFVNLSVADYELAKKINELIDEVNKLKE